MHWEVCLREHIKRVEPDMDKVISMQRMCNVRLRVTKDITLDEETASIIATDYYEVIKELLVALLLRNGLKSENHECLIAFFKHTFPQYEYESSVIHGLKEVRNRVSYDGIFVKKDYIVANRLEFEHIIILLHGLLES